MKTSLSAFFLLAIMSVSTLHAQEMGALGVNMSDNRPGGTLITKVLEGSPAAMIGLQAGDRILTINGQKTDNYRDVLRVTAADKPGDKVELMIIRGTWKTKLTATLASKGAVFTPAPMIVAPPAPIHTADNTPDWNVFDFSNPGASGAYGGGGY
jgi:predicted metalloprotease with PDZ domain